MKYLYDTSLIYDILKWFIYMKYWNMICLHDDISEHIVISNINMIYLNYICIDDILKWYIDMIYA